MLRYNFLTALSDKVAKDFITPLVVNRERLVEENAHIEIRYKLEPSLLDCDVLCVVSSFVRAYHENPSKMDLLKKYMEKARRVFFFDVNDSTGAFYSDFFPLLDRYYKKQMLRDKSQYLKKLYSRRYVFDYYHQRFGRSDTSAPTDENILRPEDLDKLRLSWNVGLGGYQRYPKWLRVVSHRIPFFSDPESVRTEPIERRRTFDVLGCFSLYENSSNIIHFHRKETLMRLTELPKSIERLCGFLESNRYYKSLKKSRVVVCPFGFGEISWKDFEAFINGAVVVKPDMSFLETWPNYYQDDETYVSYQWDFDNLQEKINTVLEDKDRWQRIAQKGQDFYRDTVNEKGKDSFCKRFNEIVN